MIVFCLCPSSASAVPSDFVGSSVERRTRTQPRRPLELLIEDSKTSNRHIPSWVVQVSS